MTHKEAVDRDPSLKGVYRLLRGVVAALILAVLFLGAAIAGTYFRGESTRNILQRSPCTENPDGEPCQRVKRESDQARSVADTCIPFEKVDRGGALLDLTRCRSPKVIAERIGQERGPAGGDASDSPQSANQQPSPASSPANQWQGGGGETVGGSNPTGHHGGGAAGPPASPPTGSPAGDGGADQVPTPAGDQSAAGSTSSSSSTNTTTSSESTTATSTTTTTPSAGQGLLEGTGDVVGNAGTAATEVVGGLTEGACRLLACPPPASP